MVLCNFTHNSKSQSATFYLTAQYPIKAFENMRAFSWRNTRAIIFHFEYRLRTLCICKNPHSYAAAFLCIA